MNWLVGDCFIQNPPPTAEWLPMGSGEPLTVGACLSNVVYKFVCVCVCVKDTGKRAGIVGSERRPFSQILQNEVLKNLTISHPSEAEPLVASDITSQGSQSAERRQTHVSHRWRR